MCINALDAAKICDELDKCPNDYNPYQEDFDFDNLGDICDGINIAENNQNKQLVKTIDLLGRYFSDEFKKPILLNIYNDGSVEKIFSF